MFQAEPVSSAQRVAVVMWMPMSEANTAGGVVEARCNSAVLRLARVMIPSWFIRRMSEAG